MSAAVLKHREQEEISINLTRLDARVGSLENGMSSLGIKVDSLAGVINANQRTNWPMLLGLGSLLLGLIGGAWMIVDLKSQNALTPVLIQNAISTKEREENYRNIIVTMEGLNKEVGSRRAGFAALQQQVAEAEGQHRNNDNERNGKFQHLEGQIAWLYEFLSLPKPSPMTHLPAIGRIIDIPIPND